MFCSLCLKNFKSSTLGEHALTNDYIDVTNPKNDILLNKLSEVTNLCRILECPHLLLASNTITYENNVSGCEILSVILNLIEKTIWKELDKAIVFGIMVDESTDISYEPHFIIYIKYYLYENIKVHFLKLL
ncbi:zinc finger protein 862-like [Rhizophagus clarus]|uniref:Zinc finger protein 862-like n=1 Tax=Rhizophagus clarus TaxID=94130 RepID=A0A8H3MB73_9GLOM|nr:zinc finger protein 862-like [Rhizophagus clarus]